MQNLNSWEEFCASFKEPRKRWALEAVTDEEVRERLSAYVFPTTDFERVGDNVVIADNACVVIPKQVGGCPTALAIFDSMPEYGYIDSKMWATDDVKADIRRAFDWLKEEKQ